VASGVGLLAEVVLAFRYGYAPPEACQAIRDSELALDVPVPVGLLDMDTAVLVACLWCFGEAWPLALEIWGLDKVTLVLFTLGMEQVMDISRDGVLAAFASGMAMRH
jgi:hypothetical protein